MSKDEMKEFINIKNAKFARIHQSRLGPLSEDTSHAGWEMVEFFTPNWNAYTRACHAVKNEPRITIDSIAYIHSLSPK